MTSWFARSRPSVDHGGGCRVGLFGLLGSGNLGNDASMDVVLSYVRQHHPDVVVDAMCMGPEQVSRRFGIEAVPILWSRKWTSCGSRFVTLALRVLGKGIDAARTLSWVRRHDLIIVPGMGVLETSLPLRATGTPYAMFLLCAAGRIVGTRVALVCVGASEVRQGPARRLIDWAVAFASYRSYRDRPSQVALEARGLNVRDDPVYTDLVFASRTPESREGDRKSVGVGIMAYHGGTDDRREAEAINERYMRTMVSFVLWLLDNGYRIHLLWGDEVDDPALQQVLTTVRSDRPHLAGNVLLPSRLSSLADVMREMEFVGSVIGTRFHTVLCGLKLCRPTISIGYGAKHDALMAGMGMSEFSLAARSIDLDTLIGAFTTLQGNELWIRQTLAERNAGKRRALAPQFSDLDDLLTGRGTLGASNRSAVA